jgi:dephospho-CoA kinase
MTVIGITGPSGAGKGLVSDIMRKYGVHVIDSDALYHDIITPPSDCLDELVRHFGKDILFSDGSLNRKSLAAIVFEDDNNIDLDMLNSITHKYVVAEIRKTVARYRALDVTACVIDAPLLIEAELCEDCDYTLAVLANEDIRIKRISLRDGIDIHAAKKRISAQKSDEFYMENTDSVLFNNGDAHTLEVQILKLLEKWGVEI